MVSEDELKKPKLLMIHGYGSTGTAFYAMIRHLKKFFRVTTIDLLGMGSSGRPKYNATKSDLMSTWITTP